MTEEMAKRVCVLWVEHWQSPDNVLFLSDEEAEEAAKKLAYQYPGERVHILRSSLCFMCEAKPPHVVQFEDEAS